MARGRFSPEVHENQHGTASKTRTLTPSNFSNSFGYHSGTFVPSSPLSCEKLGAWRVIALAEVKACRDYPGGAAARGDFRAKQNRSCDY